MPEKIKDIQERVTKYVTRRTDLIEQLNTELEEKVSKAQAVLLDDLLSEVADNLEADRGKIKNNAQNRKLLNTIDVVFDNFAAGENLTIIRSIVTAGKTIIDLNQGYYSIFAKPAELIPITAQVKSDLNIWLGVTGDDKLKQNGYLNTLLKSSGIQQEVKQVTLQAVQTQQGYQNFKSNLKEYIAGRPTPVTDRRISPPPTGKLKQYYRNYAYDTYSQIDRSASSQFAEKLGMTYAIYEGGIMGQSRQFCIDRNGKVFTREEILKFNPTKAKPPNYNPITDLGGYGCRHSLNWISYELAVLLRPDLKRE